MASASSAGSSASSFRAVSMNRRDWSGSSAFRGGCGLRSGMSPDMATAWLVWQDGVVLPRARFAAYGTNHKRLTYWRIDAA